MKVAPFPRHGHFTQAATPIPRPIARRHILYAPPRPPPRKAAVRGRGPLRRAAPIPHPDPLANIVQQQALKEAGVPLPGVQAALAVDALINRVASPTEALGLAALNPIFLGTGAIKGAVSVAGDVVGDVGGFLSDIFSTPTLTTADYVRLGTFAPGSRVVAVDEVVPAVHGRML